MYKIINSLVKGLKILEAFTPARPALTLQEIIEAVDLPKPTVYRFLYTLTSFNYLSFDQERGKYFLSPKVMSLGFATLANMELRDVALPYLAELSTLTGENTSLGILEDIEVLYIARFKKKRIFNVDLDVGSRVNVYQTAIGRAILAFLSENKLAQVCDALSKNNVDVKSVGQKGKGLSNILEEVREKGFALNNEEFIKGVRAVGAPVFDSKGDVEGAINIAVFSNLVSLKELVNRIVPMLTDTAKTVSEARGLVKGSMNTDAIAQ